MNFPDQDAELLTQELGTYGITYADSLDCLIIAPALKGHPDWIDSTVGYLSPLKMVGLMLYHDDFVGAMFPSVSELIQYFLNGKLPEELPADYIADMMDLYLANMRFQRVIEDGEVLLEARAMHACARDIMLASAELPPAIVDRMRATLGSCSATVH